VVSNGVPPAFSAAYFSFSSGLADTIYKKNFALK
jgi:hypothetical protein